MGQLERMRPATFAHSRRVAASAVRVARHARVPTPLVSDVYWGALVHDIGELNIRRSLLDGILADRKETRAMSEHTIVGARWLAAMPGLAPLVPYPRAGTTNASTVSVTPTGVPATACR